MDKQEDMRYLELSDDDDDYEDLDEYEDYEEYEDEYDWDEDDDESDYGGRQRMMRRGNRPRQDDAIDWSRYSDHDRW